MNHQQAPWHTHPIREECRRATSWKFLGLACAWIAAGLALGALIRTAVSGEFTLASSGLLLIPALGSAGLAFAFLVRYPQHLRRVSWIVDSTAPAAVPKVQVHATRISRFLRVTLFDEAGTALGKLQFDSIEGMEIPAHLPRVFPADLYRPGGALGNTVVVAWDGRLFSGTLIPPATQPRTARQRHLHAALRTLPSLLLTLLGIWLISGARSDWALYDDARNVTEKGQASRLWPSTRGRVIRTRIDTSSRSSGGRPPKQIPITRPIITYQYQTGGQSQEGETVQIGLTWSPYPRDAKDVLARYPVDADVTVHYNPSDPKEAVLKTGPHPDAEHRRDALRFEAISLGAMGGVITLASLLNAGRRWRQSHGSRRKGVPGS